MNITREWGLLVMLIVNPLLIILYENASIFSKTQQADLASVLSIPQSATPAISYGVNDPQAIQPEKTRSVASSPELATPSANGQSAAALTNNILENTSTEGCRYIRPVCQE